MMRVFLQNPLENLRKKGIGEAKKKSSPKDVKQADIVDEEPISRSNRNHKRNKNNRRAGKLLGLLLSSATYLVSSCILGYRYVSDAVGAKDVNSTKFVSVEIPENSGSSYIGQLLNHCVIKFGKVFNYYIPSLKTSQIWKSGYYNLQASMTMDEIIEALQKKEG